MYMVKMVSLSEPAYALLKRHKAAGMSFSDVVNAGRWETGPEKTESTQDLLRWLDSLPKSKKKTNWSQHIDEIVYGVKRP
ncbi:MAG: hypothetical protein AAB932_03635 [Patescibacteria group bacterium]